MRGLVEHGRVAMMATLRVPLPSLASAPQGTQLETVSPVFGASSVTTAHMGRHVSRKRQSASDSSSSRGGPYQVRIWTMKSIITDTGLPQHVRKAEESGVVEENVSDDQGQ